MGDKKQSMKIETVDIAGNAKHIAWQIENNPELRKQYLTMMGVAIGTPQGESPYVKYVEPKEEEMNWEEKQRRNLLIGINMYAWGLYFLDPICLAVLTLILVVGAGAMLATKSILELME